MHTKTTKQGERLCELSSDRKVEVGLMSMCQCLLLHVEVLGRSVVNTTWGCVGKMRVRAICEQPCLCKVITPFVASNYIRRHRLSRSVWMHVCVCVCVNTTHLSSKHFVEQHSVCPPVYGPSIWLICNDLCGKKEKMFRYSPKLKQMILYKIHKQQSL